MIKLSLELTRSESNGPVYRSHIELVEKVSGESFTAVKAKREVDGWVIHSWSVSEQLPYDEGYTAADAGLLADTTAHSGLLKKQQCSWYFKRPAAYRVEGKICMIY